MNEKTKSEKASGFSLIEILAVLALVSILTGIMLPALGKTRTYLKKAKTRAQFHRYIQAYYSFKSDYGRFPKMGKTNNKFRLFENNVVFIQTLSGRKKDERRMDNPIARQENPYQTQYYTFTEREFASAESAFSGAIVDAFGNPHIVIVIDEDGDGVIAADALLYREKDLHAAIAIYSIENDDRRWPAVYSW